MEREDILKIAQKKGEDERKQLMTMKAQRKAGNVSMLYASCLAITILLYGYYINENLTFDFVTVTFLIMNISSVHNVIIAIYELCAFKKRSRIWDIIIFGSLIVISTIKVIMCLLG